jgi:hypothetical protein
MGESVKCRKREALYEAKQWLGHEDTELRVAQRTADSGYVNDPDGTARIVRPGDWVVKGPLDQVLVLSDTDFHNTFKIVEE